jgi:hypothetical protein
VSISSAADGVGLRRIDGSRLQSGEGCGDWGEEGLLANESEAGRYGKGGLRIMPTMWCCWLAKTA